MERLLHFVKESYMRDKREKEVNSTRFTNGSRTVAELIFHIFSLAI